MVSFGESGISSSIDKYIFVCDLEFFLIASYLELAGLNFILVQFMTFLRPQEPLVTEFFVTVRSFLYALIGGCPTQDVTDLLGTPSLQD